MEHSNLALYSLKKILEISQGDRSYVSEMLMVFIDQCSDIKENLEKANAEHNAVEIGIMAHKLKSSVQIMGLEIIEKQVFEIEELSRKDVNNPKIFKLSEFVVQNLALILPALKSELKNTN